MNGTYKIWFLLSLFVLGLVTPSFHHLAHVDEVSHESVACVKACDSDSSAFSEAIEDEVCFVCQGNQHRSLATSSMLTCGVAPKVSNHLQYVKDVVQETFLSQAPKTSPPLFFRSA